MIGGSKNPELLTSSVRQMNSRSFKNQKYISNIATDLLSDSYDVPADQIRHTLERSYNVRDKNLLDEVMRQVTTNNRNVEARIKLFDDHKTVRLKKIK